VLKRYAAELQADPERWLFLTGKQDDVYRLIKNGFHLPVAQRTGDDRKPGDEVAHSQSVLLVDARGYVVGKFDGTSEVEMAKLERAIRRLRDNGSSTKGKPGNG
jgi:protein SCO1/2